MLLVIYLNFTSTFYIYSTNLFMFGSTLDITGPKQNDSSKNCHAIFFLAVQEYSLWQCCTHILQIFWVDSQTTNVTKFDLLLYQVYVSYQYQYFSTLKYTSSGCYGSSAVTIVFHVSTPFSDEMF